MATVSSRPELTDPAPDDLVPAVDVSEPDVNVRGKKLPVRRLIHLVRAELGQPPLFPNPTQPDVLMDGGEF